MYKMKDLQGNRFSNNFCRSHNISGDKIGVIKNGQYLNRKSNLFYLLNLEKYV
jgi:hypothetical protein